MIDKLTNRQLIPYYLINFLIIILLIFGICIRFTNLDQKVYWIDEAYTSLRISGHTETEFVQQFFNGQIINLEEIQKYQQYNPETSLLDTINSLASESPQHPPLYYVLARLWVQLWGNSVTIIRSLSAIISLLLFPCIYWLCLELFKLPLTGWVAIALIAVSPFHILYAQEAREYSLWTVAIALSSAALLHAIRLKTKISWGIYAATLALSLYSFTFSLFVAISHGIYVFVSEGWRFSKTVFFYLLATLLGLVAFSPWLFVLITNLSQAQETADWTELRVAFGFLLQRWIVNLGNIFFDLNTGYKYLTIPHLALLGLVIYSIYFLVRQTAKPVWLLVLSLVATTALALVIPDLILGGIRSVNARYLIPSYLGVQLAVAYLLAAKISLVRTKRRQRQVWRFIFIAIITGSILSCVVSSQSVFWWHKSPSKHKYNPEIAAIVNRAPNPLLISDNSTAISSSFATRILALSYLLDQSVKLQLFIEPNVPKIPDGFSDVFLFSPSQNIVSKIEQQQAYKAELAFQRDNFWLWKLIKKNSYE